MMTEMEAIDFAAMSAEFFVKDVEANLTSSKSSASQALHGTARRDGPHARASLPGGTSARTGCDAPPSRRRAPAPGVTCSSGSRAEPMH